MRGRAEREEDALAYCGLPCSGAGREDRDGFVTGHYAGTGFMLIAREVLETMTADYAGLGYSGTHAYTEGPRSHRQHYALFDCLIEPDKIGSASWRESVWTYGEISVVAGFLKKNNISID